MKHSPHDVAETGLFINRELSWLSFNNRVLDQAEIPANPLLERLKFVAITAGNLDEFFMVRIAGLRKMFRNGEPWCDPAGLNPSAQLQQTREKIDQLLQRQYELLFGKILPELERSDVYLVHPQELTDAEKLLASDIFRSDVMPVLTPFAVDPAHPFPQLNSGAIEIALRLLPANSGKDTFAFVEVPALLERFVELPSANGLKRFMLLEELIIDNLQCLFAGSEIVECFPFRITRDMDFSVEDENAADLLEYIGQKLQQRRRREPVRLELPPGASGPLAEWIRSAFALETLFEYPIRGALHLKQFAELAAKVPHAHLAETPHLPVMPPEFMDNVSVFESLRRYENILVAPPYHDFAPVVRMLEEAANDPNVLAIKQTLYRVSGNSPVVRALQRAARNGKQVTVVLELKARFDEENNIAWAQALDECGAHVVYGIAGLKIHAKALLIVRREEGFLRRYCHLGTGNYNDRTALTYTDIGMMSSAPELCSDIANMFNILTGCSAPENCYRKILLAPFTLRAALERLIEREIEHVRAGGKGEIIAKMNSFSDEKMVRLIHRAADAGVEITLIVRGICCLCPRESQSKNLKIISIVDRFLEHSRIFYFRNQGSPEYYLSSADWMTRNLDRRIELMFPVEEEELTEQLRSILTLHISDCDKGRRLLSSGEYTPFVPLEDYTAARSQQAIADWFRSRTAAALDGSAGTPLKIRKFQGEKKHHG
ncbi:MAG: polyphosphate kinase 1 [Lentisphaeria bacterium]|nr:polyphosphate kinase 1 [Lentisphaeria bacterium]